MATEIACACGKVYRVKDNPTGRTVHCPACKAASYVRGYKPDPDPDPGPVGEPDPAPTFTPFEAKVLRNLSTLIALVALIALPMIVALVLVVAGIARVSG